MAIVTRAAIIREMDAHELMAEIDSLSKGYNEDVFGDTFDCMEELQHALNQLI